MDGGKTLRYYIDYFMALAIVKKTNCFKLIALVIEPEPFHAGKIGLSKHPCW